MLVRTPQLAVALAALTACGPIVSTDDGADGGEANSASSSTSSSSGSESTSTPACVPNTAEMCTCPDGARGTQFCETGAFGPCLCEPDGGSTSAVDTSTSTGEVLDASSSGAPVDPSGCFPLDQPCEGTWTLESNADAAAIERCSRIEGSLQILWGVDELPPLPCLRELGNQLYAEGLFIPDLSALSNLERIEGELEIYQTALTTLGLESLVFTSFFSLAENGQMVTLGVPNLELIEAGIDVVDNPMLPTCELETLAEEAAAPGASVFYVGNADDGCPSSR